MRVFIDMNLQENINRIQSMMGDIKESTNKFNGVIGKFYTFDELPQQTKQDVEDMFGDEFHDEGPDDYLYRYILISPEENESYLFSVFGEWDIEDAKEDPYMKKLVRDIKKRGLDYPSVGTEGNHRALAHYILHEPLPYLEMVPREDSDLYVQENILRIKEVMLINENTSESKINKMIDELGLYNTIKMVGSYEDLLNHINSEDISDRDKIKFIRDVVTLKGPEISGRESISIFDLGIPLIRHDSYGNTERKVRTFYKGGVKLNVYKGGKFSTDQMTTYENISEDALNKIFKLMIDLLEDKKEEMSEGLH